MLGVIDILIYGLARHAELFRNLGVADAFSMQFQNLYGLIGGKLRLATRIAGFGLLIFSMIYPIRHYFPDIRANHRPGCWKQLPLPVPHCWQYRRRLESIATVVS